VRSQLKPEYRTRQREIQDLAGAVIEQHGQRDPAVQNNEIPGIDLTLPIEVQPAGHDPRTAFQIGNGLELFILLYADDVVHRTGPFTEPQVVAVNP